MRLLDQRFSNHDLKHLVCMIRDWKKFWKHCSFNLFTTKCFHSNCVTDLDTATVKVARRLLLRHSWSKQCFCGRLCLSKNWLKPNAHNQINILVKPRYSRYFIIFFGFYNGHSRVPRVVNLFLRWNHFWRKSWANNNNNFHSNSNNNNKVSHQKQDKTWLCVCQSTMTFRVSYLSH